MGYKGAVGDQFGYGILFSTAIVSFFLGAVATASRDAEAEAVAQVAGTETVPAVTPAGTSYWPPVAAFGWQQIGLGITSSPQALLIYTITGVHVAMTGVGMIFLAVMGFKAAGGQLTGRAAEGVSAAALYWFITVATYSVVWYTISITK